MRYRLFVLLLSLAYPFVGFAQEEESPYFQKKHEMGVSYGYVPSGFLDEMMEAGGGLFKMFFTSDRKINMTGAYSVDYGYFVADDVVVGATVGYSHQTHSFRYGGLLAGIMGEESRGGYSDERTYLFVMPTVKYYWKRRNHWSWYCNVGAGVHYLHEIKYELKDGEVTKDYNGKKLYFACQFSPIGLEYAPTPKLVFSLQYGYGDMGLLNFGIKTRW